MPTNVKVLVCCGLPGSGKSTFAMQDGKIDNYGHRFIINNTAAKIIVADFDYAMRENKKPRNNRKEKSIETLYLDLFGEIHDVILGKNGWKLILDGLFLTNADYLRIAKAFRDYHIIFHWWSPLRDVCAYNDRYRRETSAADVIMNAPFEEPDPVALKLASASIGKIETQRHRPQKKSGYQLFCDRYKLQRTLTSASWSNGGSSYDCYGHSYSCGAETPLASFEEFDAVIEKVNEDIKFMQYKKIYNVCVDTETYDDSGYYGGNQTSSRYICYTKNLYDKLIEMDLLPEEFW